jgi:hypothetical protein
MSEDGHSPPARIAPSPTGSPTSDLANNFTRSINIPMSSPDNDYDYARSEGDDRSPLSSPDEMSVDTAYPYHSPTPNRQAFAQNYNGNTQTYPPPVSTSPNNYAGGFVAINQPFGGAQQVPMLDTSQSGYTFSSEPIPIPAPTGYSLPGTEPQNAFASFFTSQDGHFLGDNQFVHDNWLDLYDSNNAPFTSSIGNKSPPEMWHDNFDLQQILSSQSGDGQGFDRRDSMYFPPVQPLLSRLTDFVGRDHTCRCSAQRWNWVSFCSSYHTRSKRYYHHATSEGTTEAGFTNDSGNSMILG